MGCLAEQSARQYIMQRIIIVYNPRSSRHALVQKEVLEKLRDLEGFLVGKYEVRPTDVDDNARQLAKILRDDDLVISAGGDGTATITLNGIILSNTNAKLGVLGYGNFNDLARTLGAKNLQDIIDGKVAELWPLDIKINDRHWRYSACYVTMGMFAESTAVFDKKTIRKKLKSGGKSRTIYSLIQLVKWYFANWGKRFIPNFKLNNQQVRKNVTDYLAINGRSMAKMMRGGGWFLKKSGFRSRVACFGNLFELCWFMLRSIVHRVPGSDTEVDILEFTEPAELEIQAEGEYQRLKNVRKIEVRKATRPVRVILKV